jgi:hypothetical protein
MLRCNKNQDYLIFKWVFIDSIISLIVSSYFQPKNTPKQTPSVNSIIFFPLFNVFLQQRY